MANNRPSTSFHSSKNYFLNVIFFGQPPHQVCDGVFLHIVAGVCLKTPSTSYKRAAYCTTQKFYLPPQQLFSERCGSTITNCLDLMNIPFSLDEKLLWTSKRHPNCHKSLQNYQDLIKEIETEFQTASEVKSRAVNLRIIKTVVVSEDEFGEWESLWDNHRDYYKYLCYKEPMNQMLWRMRALDVLERVDVRVATDCSICLTDMKVGKLIRLPCSHVFHEDCILQWLKNRLSCPYCRATCPPIQCKKLC